MAGRSSVTRPLVLAGLLVRLLWDLPAGAQCAGLDAQADDRRQATTSRDNYYGTVLLARRWVSVPHLMFLQCGPPATDRRRVRAQAPSVNSRGHENLLLGRGDMRTVIAFDVNDTFLDSRSLDPYFEELLVVQHSDQTRRWRRAVCA